MCIYCILYILYIYSISGHASIIYIYIYTYIVYTYFNMFNLDVQPNILRSIFIRKIFGTTKALGTTIYFNVK